MKPKLEKHLEDVRALVRRSVATATPAEAMEFYGELLADMEGAMEALEDEGGVYEGDDDDEDD